MKRIAINFFSVKPNAKNGITSLFSLAFHPVRSGVQKGVFLALLLAFFCGVNGWGQATTATLVGTVTDSSGAAIPKATVQITEQNTGQQYTREADGSGFYEFTFLPPGTYSVRVGEQGFQTAETRDVRVVVNTTQRTDIRLKVGSATQTVTVTDRAPALQTDRADVSGQLASRQIIDLPLTNSRNFQSLEQLIPGVSAPIYDHSSFFDQQNSQSFNVNGQSEMSNNLQLEGIDDNERTGLLQVYIPPAAAIRTVDVETSNYAPEFGRSAGAVTNIILKSGTNAFHGSVYEYNQVSATQARDYFNRVGFFPRFTYNYYGGTLGGPIVKNHTFFFVDFLRNSTHQGQFNLFTVPTAAFRAGNLSASPTPIYDPDTGNPDGTGRTQFQGNQIPAARISQIAKNILALVPLPNIPGAGATNNYQVNTGYQQDADTFDVKLDQRLGQEDHLSYRYSWQHTSTIQEPAFGLAGGPGSSGGNGTNHVYNTAVEYTHVFSPVLFTDLRAGVDHYRNSVRQSDYGTDASTAVGIPGVNVSEFTSGLAGINIDGGYSSPIVGYNSGYPWDRGETNIDFENSWTGILGEHSIKFGVEVRRVRDDLTQGDTYGPRGAFTFADGQTALNAPGSQTSYGNDFASFLLDLPDSVGRDVNVNDASWRQTLYFAYIQDTYQATHSLTLTYGLRWELYPPGTPNKSGGFSQYIPATNSLEVAGYGDIPKDLGMPLNARNFEPRVGFAWRVNSKTVLRGGYGISYTPFQFNEYAYNYPVRQNISFNPTSSYLPAPATLATGFPAAPQPDIPSNGIITNATTTSQWYVVNPHYKFPNVQSWNLTVERDLGSGWVGSVAYVGNVGRQIPADWNLNAGFVAGAGAAGQPEYATFGRTATTTLVDKGTSSNYNALQARLTHHYSNGLSVTAGYAYQKSLGFVSTEGAMAYFNFYLDPSRDYAPLNWNRTQTFTSSYVYDLPFGKKRRYLQRGPAAAVLGDWQWSGIVTAGTGEPLFITASSSQLNAPGNTQVPNLVKPFHKLYHIGAGRQWFDPTSFAAPTGAVLGDLGKNVYSGPGYVAFDTTLRRDIPLTERLTLQLRADAFNALNHPTFDNPNTDSTSTSFGQVTGTANSSPRILEFAGTLSF